MNPKNVSRLREIYLKGCYRLEPEHYVPALNDEASLDRALRSMFGVVRFTSQTRKREVP